MEITTDPAVLRRLLQPGDVLAFDSLHPVSGLIQWADKAPTNHLALVVGPDHVLMANPAEDAAPDHAVARHSVSDLLGASTVLAVRVLRAELDDAGRENVVTKAVEYEEASTVFAVLDLAWLAPSALMRSYDPREVLDGPNGAVLVAILQMAARAALRRVDTGHRTLTCSEFVYRCLSEAGVPVEISNPLQTNGFDASLWDPELQKQDADNWDALARHNVGLRDLAPFDAESRHPNPNVVTPGDLWRSPSMERVAILVTRG